MPGKEAEGEERCLSSPLLQQGDEMAIESVGGIDKLVSTHDQVRRTYQAAAQQQSDAAHQQEEGPVAVSIRKASSTMGRLESFNEDKNRLAQNIRETDGALQCIVDGIDGMAKKLDTIKKNFPPFSRDSEERKELLMSYVSLRKEIIKMMVPPPPPPVYEKNTSLWEKLGYNQNDGIASAVPDIAATATDAEVGAAREALSGLRAVVGTGRNELARFVSE
jgi:hypothetical protein